METEEWIANHTPEVFLREPRLRLHNSWNNYKDTLDDTSRIQTDSNEKGYYQKQFNDSILTTPLGLCSRLIVTWDVIWFGGPDSCSFSCSKSSCIETYPSTMFLPLRSDSY